MISGIKMNDKEFNNRYPEKIFLCKLFYYYFTHEVNFSTNSFILDKYSITLSVFSNLINYLS